MKKIYTKPLRMPDDMPGRTTDSIEVTYNDDGMVVGVDKLIGGTKLNILIPSIDPKILENYYTKEEITELLSGIKEFNVILVEQLPNTGEANTIYLIPSQDQKQENIKDEYLWINNNWELIGSTRIDLSDYVTTSDLATALSDYATTSELTSGLAEKQDALTTGENITIDSGGTISATDTTYEASDFDIKDLADSTGLREKWSSKQDALIEVQENGFYIVDENMNIVFQIKNGICEGARLVNYK